MPLSLSTLYSTLDCYSTLSEPVNPLPSRVSLPDLPEFPAWQIQIFDSVNSTNAVLWDLLQQGAAIGTVVIAQSQQAGRGQWGRQWLSEEGGLYLSIALAPNLPVQQAAQLTLSSVWGIAHVLQMAGIPVQIKWLNDLVIDRRKLGGILTETRVYQERILQTVIGVGINWCNPVPDHGINLVMVLPEQSEGQDTTVESGLALSIASLEQLAAATVWGIRCGYERWRQYGAAALVSAYDLLLVNRGDELIVNGRRAHILGITEMGQLRVGFLSHSGEVAAHSSPTAQTLIDPGAVRLGYDRSIPKVTLPD